MKLSQRILKIAEKLDKKSKAHYATVYDTNLVPLGASADGIYLIEVTTKRGYFAMSDNVCAPVTVEQLEEWERDSVEFEADYYYNEVFGNEDSWNELSDKEQKDEIDKMTQEMVNSKLDGMSGSFDWKFKGKTEEYYLDMISAGQGMMNDLTNPVISKKDFDILKKAWNELHLKKLNWEEKMNANQVELMHNAVEIYQKYKRQSKKLLEKSIQMFMLKDKKGKLIRKILRKMNYDI